MKNEPIPHDDPRLTAYALGELDEAEVARVERAVETDEACRAAVDEVRALAQVLERELASESPPELTAVHRAAIATRAKRASRLLPKVVLSVASAAAAVLLALLGRAWLLHGEDETASFAYNLFGDSPPVVGSAPAQVRAPRALEGLGYSGAEGGQPLDSLRQLGYVDGPAHGRFGNRIGASRRLSDLAQLGYAGVEHPSTEAYDRIRERGFTAVASDPLSTFSIDVDTASYANVRRFLNEGRLPPPDAVRIEELVNYFSYAYPEPAGADPFSVSVEVAGAPWAPGHTLVRVGLKGRAIEGLYARPRNLVFLLDVSGSMNQPNKLPLLKRAMSMLVEQLSADDRVAIVVYAGRSGLVLPSTSCEQKETILAALARLEAGGSTNGGAGIQLAYDVARRNFVEGGVNRVILATDGDFNVGVSDRGSLVRMVEDRAKGGVFLSVLGFGTGNLKDSQMEQLADDGNGNYSYVDSLHEARKVLVEELGATLETIAKDVKIQVEFNPAAVAAWRLIGYENRVLAHRDFNDDAVDAGEIGAGHTVTALYELVPAGSEVPGAAGGVDPLRYQTRSGLSAGAAAGELLNVKLRYKEPDGDTSRLLETPVAARVADWTEATDDFRFAAAVAAWGMLLRGSEHAGEADLELVRRLALAGLAGDPTGRRVEFLNLVRATETLRSLRQAERELPSRDER